MSWPLTGKPLAEFNRMVSDWKQYSTFPFIGPDDINRLYDVIVAAGVTGATLTDVGLRPQYWLAQLVIQVGNSGGPCPPCPPCPPLTGIDWGPDDSTAQAIFSIDVPNIIFYSLENVSGNLDLGHSILLKSASFPKLKTVGGDFSLNSNSLLVSILVPLLETIDGDFSVSESNITEMVAPALILIGGALLLGAMPSLTTISFPLLVTTGNLFGGGSPALTSVNLSVWLPTNGVTIDFNGDALSQTSVDHILNRGVASPGFVSGAIDLSGGTNSAPSSTAPGSDYDILIGRGVNVIVNP